MEKYRVIESFIAFGKTPTVGEIIDLNSDQAAALSEIGAIAPYEVKVERPPKETKKKAPAKKKTTRKKKR